MIKLFKDILNLFLKTYLMKTQRLSQRTNHANQRRLRIRANISQIDNDRDESNVDGPSSVVEHLVQQFVCHFKENIFWGRDNSKRKLFSQFYHQWY